jgi:hypothetical protein
MLESWRQFTGLTSNESRPVTWVFWSNVAALLLCVVGLLQMSGYLIGVRTLQGLGAATAASPFPKVFSDVDGLETFASQFVLRIHTASGEDLEKEITPELYQRLKGPYNRRNVFGAALSSAPRLPQATWQSVYCYGLRPQGPLRTELGLPEDAVRISVAIRTKTRGRSNIWILEPSCKK